MITIINQEYKITTNLLLIDDLQLWDEFNQKSINNSQTKKYHQIINKILELQQNHTINWLQSKEAKIFFNNLAYEDQEIWESIDTEWETILNNSYSTIDELLEQIYNTGKEKGYQNIQEKIQWTKSDREAIKICKNYNFHLIRKLSNDLKQSVKTEILKGIITNENPNSLANRLVEVGIKPLNGSTLSARQRAVMIARTETSRMQNTGMLQSYINEGYTEVKILTAEDNNVCNTCLTYAYEFNESDNVIYENHGAEKVHNIIKLIENGRFPPFHPNCRCTYLTVWESKTTPPENPYIIDLTPKNYLSDAILRRYKDEWDLSNINGINDDKWTKEIIQKKLESFVDKEDNLEKLSEAIYKFIQNAMNIKTESGTTYDSKFNVISELIESDSERFLDIPNEDVKQVKDSYFGLVGHSHPKSRIPLPDWQDMEVGIFNLNIKYNIIYAPGYGLTVIKNSNPKVQLDFDLVKKGYAEANKNRENYVQNNITKAKDEYKRNIQDKYISLFKQKADLKNIEKTMSHNNFKEQCAFYDDLLKQFGIEFLYMTP